jgi:hypothetical protein
MVDKPEGKRPQGRTGHRWEGNIKMDLREIGWGDMDWIGLVLDSDHWQAVVNTVMSLCVP